MSSASPSVSKQRSERERARVEVDRVDEVDEAVGQVGFGNGSSVTHACNAYNEDWGRHGASIVSKNEPGSPVQLPGRDVQVLTSQRVWRWRTALWASKFETTNAWVGGTRHEQVSRAQHRSAAAVAGAVVLGLARRLTALLRPRTRNSNIRKLRAAATQPLPHVSHVDSRGI